jgi:hypothetical protein
MSWSWADVPTFGSMGRPCFAHGGFGVGNDLGAEWAEEGRPIKIESTMKLHIRRQLRVDARGS